MRKLIYILMMVLLVTLLVVFISSCAQQGPEESSNTETSNNESTSESSSETANVEKVNVKVYLTDNPFAEVDQLIVDIPKVTYHYDVGSESSEVTVDVATKVDLLSLAGTEIKFFDLSQIPEGATLTWIGMNIDDATAIVNENGSSVKVPSDMVKVLVNSTVSSDTEVVLDFDVSRSLVKVNSPKFAYILRPVLKTYTRNKHMAKVHGEVTYENNGNAVDFALITLTKDGDSTPARFTLTNRKGMYMIGGIGPGTYELSVYTDYTLPSEDSSLTLGDPATTINLELSAGDNKTIDLNIESPEGSTTGESSTNSNKNDIKVYLTDTPLEYLDNFFVDIPSVTYHYDADNGSSDVTINVATEVDVLSLAGTEIEFFYMNNIPEGATLTKIEVKINSATAVVSGYPPINVFIQNDKVDISVDQKVSSDTEMLIDFDVAHSLVQSNSYSFKLNPTLKVYIRSKHMAKVHGEVTYENNGNAVKFALITLTKDGDSTPARFTLTNRKGMYMIGGIGPGTYELSVYTDYTLPSSDGTFSFGDPATTTEVSVGSEDTEVDLTVPSE